MKVRYKAIEHSYHVVYYSNLFGRGKLGSMEITRARRISNSNDINEIAAIIKDKLGTKEVVILNYIKLKTRIRWWWK